MSYEFPQNFLQVEYLDEMPDKLLTLQRQVLELLTGQVSSEDMVELTYAVDVDGRPVEEVASEFLRSKGLL